MEYRSERRLCAFAEGLLHGAADHYGERIEIERPACLKRGDDRCVLAVTPVA
jgi:predicted hydrocarbon binding protein